jgi:hypothetical protein
LDKWYVDGGRSRNVGVCLLDELFFTAKLWQLTTEKRDRVILI